MAHSPGGADAAKHHSLAWRAAGELLAEVLTAGAAEVDAAVAAAASAFPAWAATPPLERGRRLREAAARIRAHAQDLALLDAADCGNPVKALAADAEIAATQVEYFAGLVLEIKGETLPPRTDRSTTRSANRWAWWPASFRSTIPSCSPPARSPRRWPPATRWCSSRRSRRPFPPSS